MGTAAPILSLASMGFGLKAQADKASGEAAADQYKASQADLSAKIGQVQATQTDQYVRQGLSTTLANISAIRSAAGTSLDSPTGAAVAARTAGQSDSERQQKLENINAQVLSDQGASAFYNQSARNALSAGGSSVLGDLIGGAGSFVGGLGGAFKSMNI